MKEHIAHSGAWGLALIVIVGVSWFLLAPKTWKEWAGAGVIQAFIIVLYAEMYGFPLTIYLLARSEERKVAEEICDEYREYQKRGPMFIPRWSRWAAMTSTRDDTLG